MRYQRQIQLSEIGSEGQSLLGSSRICIIGCGGLGVPASLYLAAAGIGKIHLVDFDVIELSNLHRQPIYHENQVGQPKSEVLAKHLKSINSEIDVSFSVTDFNRDNAISLIKEFDIVLDCSDNLKTRYLINDACILRNKAFVSASIHKHEGQLSVFNYKGGPSYRCLYNEAVNDSNILSCEDTGVLGTLTSIMGSMQANEVLKMCLNHSEVLSGKVLITSILNYKTSIFTLGRNESCIQAVREHGLMAKELNNAAKSYSINWTDISLNDLNEFRFIDIREAYETPKIRSNQVVSMPISTASFETLHDVEHKKTIIVCQKGIRSISVANFLSKKWSKPVYSLKDGILPLAETFNTIDTALHEEN